MTMHRRNALAAALAPLTLALSGMPDPGRAQQARTFRLAWLTSRPIDPKNLLWAEFSEGMRELGWIEGRDFTIENLNFDGHSERLPALAAAAVQRRPDLILCAGRLPAVAAIQATQTIPVVFHYVDDPIGAGLVASLPRPGGNATGMGGLWGGISGKMLELLLEATPKAARIALLTDRNLAQQLEFEAEAKVVANRMRVSLMPIELRSPDGLESTFATVHREKPDALLIWGQPFLFAQAPRLARLSIEHRLPAIIPFEQVAEAGLLMSYGARLLDDARRLSYYVDRILKGTHPGTLPVELPSRFYLTINLRTANTIGLRLPSSLLVRADRLIE
jgi:putative ABC transport system substrate-binding protein